VPSLSIRKLEDDVYKRLKSRAAGRGHSMEEEVRRILKIAVAAPERLGDLALECFGNDGVDLELPTREAHDPVEVGK